MHTAPFVAAYAILAALSLELTRNADGIAYVWPSSGVAVAGLLLCKAVARPFLLLGFAIGSMAINIFYGTAITVSTGFTVANLVEALVGAAIIREDGKFRPRPSRPQWALRCTMAAIVAATLSATIASFAVGLGPLSAFYISWFSTVMLGIMIVTPVAVVLANWIRRGTRGRLRSRLRSDPIFISSIGVIAASLLTFGQIDYPLLFLPLAAVAFTTVLLGIEGAVIAVLVVAIIGTMLSAFGLGPIAFVENEQARTFFFQFYLLVILLTSFPIASIVERRERVERAAREGKNVLEAAARIANLGHWRFDLQTGEMTASDQMFEIYGADPARPISRETAAAAYHPDDRVRVRKLLDDAVRNMEGFDFEGRLIMPTGAIKHVSGRGDVEIENGRVVALFGVLLDTTEKAQLIEDLEKANAIALSQAEQAILASQTDSLTGIANRRKALETLEREASKPRTSEDPLAVILIDADHFKQINDRHGHGMGDRVLVEIADACSAQLRRKELFGRIGGEEFIAILPGTSEEEALAIAERLRLAVRRLNFLPDGPEKVTISLGIKIAHPDDDTAHILLAADAALYEAKRAGRDQVAMSA